jgi:hypothetical protein
MKKLNDMGGAGNREVGQQTSFSKSGVFRQGHRQHRFHRR